jgi:hypothetical protein
MKTLDARTRIRLRNILFATDFSSAAGERDPLCRGAYHALRRQALRHACAAASGRAPKATGPLSPFKARPASSFLPPVF